MRTPTAPVATLVGCLLASAVGCTKQYVFEFTNPGSGGPVKDTTVVLSSVVRTYDYLDIRFYLCKGGPVVVEGKTDKAGTVTMSLPSDLGVRYIRIDGKWFAREPSPVWQAMLTQQEYEDGAEKPEAEDGRPLMRMGTR